MFPRSMTTGAGDSPEFAANQALKQIRRNPYLTRGPPLRVAADATKETGSGLGLLRKSFRPYSTRA